MNMGLRRLCMLFARESERLDSRSQVVCVLRPRTRAIGFAAIAAYLYTLF